MKNSRQKIQQIPLEQLWDDDGSFGTRLRDLSFEELELMVGTGPVRFVEANVGKPLSWIPTENFRQFWQRARPNIARRNEIFLDDYPGSFAYGPSEWLGRARERIILLEMYH